MLIDEDFGGCGAPLTRRGLLLKNYLEKVTGSKISEEKLRIAIEEHQERRALLRQLYKLRQRDDFPLKGSEVAEVVKAGLVTPVQDYNSL